MGGLGGYLLCGDGVRGDDVCLFVCLFVGGSYASLTYFGDLLRCPHKRIVTLTKVYIATNNIRVEIIRFRKN